MKKFILVILLLLLFAASANATTISTNIPAPGAWSADLASSTIGFAGGNILRPPSTGSGLEFQDRALWNPINNTAMIFGHAHPNCSPCPSPEGRVFVKYTDSNNTWSNIGAPTFPPDDAGHNYHHDTLYTPNGDMYHRDYNSNNFRKFSHATQTWSSCSSRPGSFQVAGALTYFPDRDSLVMYDGDWGVAELSLASGNCTGAWIDRAGTIAGPGGTSGQQITGISSYHNQAVYSSLCQCIFFVGQSSTTMWKMNSNATFTQVANTPLIPGIPQNPVPPTGAIFTVDPVSQHVLMWHSNNAATTMYDYNPTTNAWSTISRGSPMFPGPEGGVTETVAIPIPTYGVIMFVSSGSSSGGQIRLYKHAAGVADTTAPTAPSGLTATPISPSQINLAWTASTDNVGVTAYLVERCTGASCVNFVQVYSVGANSQNDTSLAANTLYRYRVRATDAAGNLSAYSAIAQATTLTSGGGQTFAQRCAAAGVVLCNGFDVDADRGTVGASSIGTWRGVFRNGQSGCNTSDANRCPTIDTTTSASGGGSLKFVVPSLSDSGGSGQFFTNASSDMGTRFGSGQTFYMQVRMRFSCDFLFTNCPAGTGVRAYAGSGGWKTVDISQADRSATCFPGSVTCATSCSELEIVVQNTNNSGFVQGYHGCPGTYQGSSFVFEQQAGSEFYRQNAYAGLCPRSEVIVGNLSNCFTYKMNEWMTFKARVSIGTFVAGGTGACATFSQGCYPNSIVEYWMGREGQPLVKTHSFTFTLNASFDGTQTEKWGKFWLLPYNTSKDSTVSNPEAYLWYDELVISTADIADPGVSSDPTPPSTPVITNPIPPTASTTTSPISVSGTATDNVSVTSVTWTCIACTVKGGTATSSPGPSISWVIPAISLTAGTNIVNVVSHDAAGNASTAASLSINYTPFAGRYVASSCTGQPTPCYTTPQAASTAATAGETVFFRAGTYPGFTVANSGSPGAYITFQNYNGETVIISGSPPDCGTGDGTSMICIEAKSYVTVNGLILDGGRTSTSGIQISHSSFINLLNSEIRYANQTGVAIYYNTTHDILVQGNSWHDNVQANIEQSGQFRLGVCTNAIGLGGCNWGAGFIAHYGTSNISVIDNVVYFNHGEGLTIAGSNSTVRGNVVADSWSAQIYCTACTNTIFDRNLVYVSTEGGGYPVLPAWSPFASKTNLGALSISDCDPQCGAMSDITVSNNILLGGLQRYAVTPDFPDANGKIYGNTIISNPVVGGGLEWGNSTASISNLAIRNNVIIQNTDPNSNGAIKITPTPSSKTISNNIYYRPAGERYNYGGSIFTTLASWAAASGDASSFAANPLLINASAAPCRLWADPRGGAAPCSITTLRGQASNYNLANTSSPAYNNGVTIGAPYNTDYANITRTVPWDIGAWEFSSGITPPLITIVNPTANPTLSVTSPLFSLGGTSNLP